MADIVQVDLSFADVKFIKDAVVANTQFEFAPTGQALVRKALNARTHFIYFALNQLPDG